MGRPGRPRLAPSRKRNHKFVLYLTSREKKAIETWADSRRNWGGAGTRTAVVRRALLGMTNTNGKS